MPENLIVRAGTTLYGHGDGWQSELARQLDVPSRTVRRWVSGENYPRPGVYADILALVEAKQVALTELLAPLREAAGQDAD